MILGCGGGENASLIDTSASPIQNEIRSGLENIAKTGSLDAWGDIRDATEYGLKPMDSEKAEMILQALDDLKSKSSRSAVRAKATEILSKL
jgi:hypothetical protein